MVRRARPSPYGGDTRGVIAPNSQAKRDARQRVLDLFTREAFPDKLRIVTLPGIDWHFEKELLRRRSAYVVALESNGVIFAEARARRPRGVRRFILGRFEDEFIDRRIEEVLPLNAAWLDFSGYLTGRRREAIVRFLELTGTCRLVITCTNIHWDRESTRFFGPDKLSGIVRWLESGGGTILHSFQYVSSVNGGTSVIQVAADFNLLEESSMAKPDREPTERPRLVPVKSNRVHEYPEHKWRDLSDTENYEIRELITSGDDDIWDIANAYDCSTSQVAGIKAGITRGGRQRREKT